MDATQSIKEHLNPEKKSKGSSPWRSENFVPGVALPCGCENFSPAAFPQGHTVCVTLLLLLDLVLNAVSRQSLEKLTTSQSLRTESAQSWLQKIAPVEQLLDKLVGAVSPKLHLSRIVPSGHSLCKKHKKHHIIQDIPLVLNTTRRGGYLLNRLRPPDQPRTRGPHNSTDPPPTPEHTRETEST